MDMVDIGWCESVYLLYFLLICLFVYMCVYLFVYLFVCLLDEALIKVIKGGSDFNVAAIV